MKLEKLKEEVLDEKNAKNYVASLMCWVIVLYECKSAKFHRPHRITRAQNGLQLKNQQFFYLFVILNRLLSLKCFYHEPRKAKVKDMKKSAKISRHSVRLLWVTQLFDQIPRKYKLQQTTRDCPSTKVCKSLRLVWGGKEDNLIRK